LDASGGELEVISRTLLKRPPGVTASSGRSKWEVSTRGSTPGRALERSVVFECFYGRQVSCHPRALLEPLRQRLDGWTPYWVVSPGYTYAPPGTIPLVRWSSEWYERCATTSLLVSNSGLAPQFRKQPDQVVLQTWHGTPLKRIGLDMLTFDHFRSSYRRERVIEAQQWSYLVSPSAFCSEIFPRAFAYDGPLLEVGSPRNDCLVKPPPAAEIAGIRRRLGITDGSRVVLYAPTWRDNDKRSGSWVGNVPFDLSAAARAVGPDVVILFRAHSNISRLSLLSDEPNVVNVSDYPDIQDLYLASDALITDYSSVMFDFACLGRPMGFHCPDLEEYRDELRGWYFDLEQAAPGPITRELTAFPELVDAVLNDGKQIVASAAYRAFGDRFCASERGDAAERVADTVVADLRL